MLPEYLNDEKIKEFEDIFNVIPGCCAYQSSKFHAGIKFVAELSDVELDNLVFYYPEVDFCKMDSEVCSPIPDVKPYFFFLLEYNGQGLNFIFKDRSIPVHLPGPFSHSEERHHVVAIVLPYILEGEKITAIFTREDEGFFVTIEKVFRVTIETIDAP